MSVKYKRTLGNRAYNIANDLGIPIVTVERVIKEYLNSLKKSALNGEDIVIDGIMSIKLIKDGNGNIKSRGRVSPAFKTLLSNTEDLSSGVDIKLLFNSAVTLVL